MFSCREHRIQTKLAELSRDKYTTMEQITYHKEALESAHRKREELEDDIHALIYKLGKLRQKES